MVQKLSSRHILKHLFWKPSNLSLTKFLKNLKSQSGGPPQIEEWKESASHHLINICFAQLRGNLLENDARELRKQLEIRKITWPWDLRK